MNTVSVVVPLFNGERFVIETLRCVAAQDHCDVEIIVVDDASTDDSVAAARASGVRFELIRQPGAGVSAARNAGAAAARGEFICFLDQDDCWHPRHLARQLECLRSHPEACVVVSPYQHWYPDAAGDWRLADLWAAETGDQIDADYSGWVYHQFLLDCWALTSATMIRREALRAAGGFDARRPYGEDWELWLRLSRRVQFVKLKGPPVLYRQHMVQGSRLARPVDHRTELLLAAVREHGYASRDGRRTPAALFRRTVARYQMEFGVDHLQRGDRVLGVRALLRAWLRDPSAWRSLALALGGAAGWRPRARELAPRHPEAA